MNKNILLSALLMLFSIATSHAQDIDKDGSVSISDITILIDYYLGTTVEGIDQAACDVDGDGSVTINDVTCLIDLYLNPVVTDPNIYITYSGTTATVKGAPKDVTCTIDGANVTITNTNETDEYTFVLDGTSTNGSLTYNGVYKCTFVLNNLNLTSTTSSPLDIECGKRVNLVLSDGTTNSLTDAASSLIKGCLYCKGHLEVGGAGTLNVTGKANHAISTKEYLQLKKTTGSINIVSAANDAMHIGQYFQMNGGTVSIDANTVGDGIQVEATTDPLDEMNGQMLIKGGTLNIDVTSQDTKALKADADIAISGGTFTINAKGNGSRGIQTDGNMTISAEDNPTSILITASGAKCTLAECADDPHKCTGIKVDGNLTITGGSTTVYNTGKKSKGIKVGGIYTNNGGTVNANVESTL